MCSAAPLHLLGNYLTNAPPTSLSASLQDETLEELFLSFTGVSGLLPNVIPEDSPLRVLYAIGNGKVEPALNGVWDQRQGKGAAPAGQRR
jgi:hypothetical protein